MLPFRYTLVNNKCLYIYRHNIQWIPNIYIMMGTFHIWYMMLMMIHCRQVDEVHMWCILDYGVMWCGDM